ncbi:MAG: 16S rRNA (adenine(1518)-N(6)/adenine(1519)-N(6))-dimethyltransferase RsmA [Bacteroidales bacterium]|nr:16S rRNA (adenine(1518)-N(6)/adenine(1519)-N(6))-dimethyltransferase RsmA [Bacteroidales bacterium]MDZ4204261.1 16S rRNA (adenine(1518)-N(6)/adenine(1519)-N(6))-dimethyltransferase RsmA [Bacteroidales bacterium]
MIWVKPKKHLGQHFLHDPNLAQKIAGSLVGTSGNVLEIGPGTGVLTQFLLENKNINLKAIEIDKESVAYLRIHFPELRDNLIEGDFLRTDLKEIFEQPFSIIGNFPYNISSQILFKVLENRHMIPEVVGMVQKEVAERIAAPPGSKTYGIMSVLLQAWYDIEYLFTVSENVFTPPPNVKSAVIRLKRNHQQSLNCNEVLFKTIVKTAFNQRRKKLRNALSSLIATGNSDGLPFMDNRAEQLSVEDFVLLTSCLQ